MLPNDGVHKYHIKKTVSLTVDFRVTRTEIGEVPKSFFCIKIHLNEIRKYLTDYFRHFVDALCPTRNKRN